MTATESVAARRHLAELITPLQLLVLEKSKKTNLHKATILQLPVRNIGL